MQIKNIIWKPYTKTVHTLVFLFFVSSNIVHVSIQTPMTFVHPGVVYSKFDLDFVKSKIRAQEKPWIPHF